MYTFLKKRKGVRVDGCRREHGWLPTGLWEKCTFFLTYLDIISQTNTNREVLKQ
jgi:hypothetical protein